jgi:hypothetical protein
MSESDQFRQYAEEALLWAAQSKTKEEKQLLLELVCTWTQAAVPVRQFRNRVRTSVWRLARNGSAASRGGGSPRPALSPATRR